MKYLLLIALLMVTNDDARRANEAYQKGDYAAAEQGYLRAIEQSPDDARLYFNLGNALAQQGKFDEATAAYERFKDRTNDPVERAKADYNLGNIYGNQEKWDRAAEQYKQALRQNPDDPEAKYNYEYSNRMLQQQQQEQQQQDQNQDQQEQNQEGEQDQESQPDQGNEDQQNEQNQQNQQDQQEQSGNEQQQEQQQPRNPNEMTQEEANRILNALDNKEQDLLKDYHKNKIPSTKRNVKNW